MKEIVEIADRYDVTVSTEIRADLAPRDAILTEAKKRGHDLIVMGVSRRSGDKLFFGDTAAALLEKSPGSIMFVASYRRHDELDALPLPVRSVTPTVIRDRGRA